MVGEEGLKIAVGVAGWSYPDWVGYVYERNVRDGLAFLASYIDMVEVNSTFYRVPEARQSESWLRRTRHRPDFFFTAKLSREITHEHRQDRALVQRFVQGLYPLREAGKLHAVLAQFRYDFSDDVAARDHLTWIAEQLLACTPLIMEVRHRSWQYPEALEFLHGLGLSIAHLDYPLSRQSFDLDVVPHGKMGYFRLHGRNADAWFDSKSGRDETYNYYYSRSERQQLVERAQRIVRQYRSLTIVANNHYQGKEVANALQIKAALSGHRVSVPPKLLDHYDELCEVADESSLEQWRNRSQDTSQRLFW